MHNFKLVNIGKPQARGCPRCGHWCDVWHNFIDTNNREVRIYRCSNCRLKWEETDEGTAPTAPASV